MTTPEPSPLPRFGIRHLLGLTAALAVAFTLWRLAHDRFIESEFTQATSVKPYLKVWATQSFITSVLVGLSAFVIGCAISIKRQVIGWRLEPGHYLALISFTMGLRSLYETGVIWGRSIDVLVFSLAMLLSVTSFAFTVAALVRTGQKRWKWVFGLLLTTFVIATSNTIAFMIFGRRSVGTILTITYLNLAIKWLIPLLVMVAMTFDTYSKLHRHWSHWVGAITYLVYSVVGLAMPFLMNWIIR